jgi:hypothetical protein
MPKEPGILLLQKDPIKRNAYHHIGLYVGEGKCVHARGHAYGVVEDPMPQLWTHWARASWLTYDLPEENITWASYLGVGDLAMVDTSFAGGLSLSSLPNTKGLSMGVRAANKTVVTIEEVPDVQNDPEAFYWRRITVQDKRGRSVTGYVYAKQLTVLPGASTASVPAPRVGRPHSRRAVPGVGLSAADQ